MKQTKNCQRKTNVLKNEQTKMLNKSLGSTQETKCTVGYKMAAFVIIIEGPYLFFFGELKHEPKYVETETSIRPTVLFLWRKAL